MSRTHIHSTSLADGVGTNQDRKLNYDMIRLTLFGFSTDAISEATGLSKAQVNSRIRMYKLQGQRAMFRAGITEHAQKIIKIAKRVPTEEKKAEMQKYHKLRNRVLEALRRERENGKPAAR